MKVLVGCFIFVNPFGPPPPRAGASLKEYRRSATDDDGDETSPASCGGLIEGEYAKWEIVAHVLTSPASCGGLIEGRYGGKGR